MAGTVPVSLAGPQQGLHEYYITLLHSPFSSTPAPLSHSVVNPVHLSWPRVPDPEQP